METDPMNIESFCHNGSKLELVRGCDKRRPRDDSGWRALLLDHTDFKKYKFSLQQVTSFQLLEITTIINELMTHTNYEFSFTKNMWAAFNTQHILRSVRLFSKRMIILKIEELMNISQICNGASVERVYPLPLPPIERYSDGEFNAKGTFVFKSEEKEVQYMLDSVSGDDDLTYEGPIIHAIMSLESHDHENGFGESEKEQDEYLVEKLSQEEEESKKRKYWATLKENHSRRFLKH